MQTQTNVRQRTRNETVCNTCTKHSFSETERTFKPKASSLLEWSEIQSWQQWDNELIETGYRPAKASYTSCFHSCTQLHNETANIFSHLIGAVLFCGLPLGIYHELQPRYHEATRADIVVFSIYAAGVTICFTLSACYHMLMNHSEAIFHFGFKLDYQGVIVLMWGATVPLVYYTFLDDSSLQTIYLTIISICAITASIMTFTPQFSDSNSHRTSVFAALAISTLFCVLHGMILHGWQEQNRRFPMRSIGLTLVLNSLGAGAYALRFPEKWWRRTFDIWGSSHQIMHVMIVAAALTFWMGCLGAFDQARGGRVGRLSHEFL